MRQQVCPDTVRTALEEKRNKNGGWDKGVITEVARELGITRAKVDYYRHELTRTAATADASTGRKVEEVAHGDERRFSVTCRQDLEACPTTAAELAASLDLDPLLWEAKSFEVSWHEVAMRLRADKVRCWRAKATFRLKKGGAVAFNLVKEVVKHLQGVRFRTPMPPKVSRNRDRDTVMAELNVSDLHIGKLCYPHETGTRYNVEIALKYARAAYADFLSRAAAMYHVEHILLPVGQDLFHVDTAAHTTTAGTSLDTDDRVQRFYKKAAEFYIAAVLEMSGLAPVHVMIVPGNHDSLLTSTFGVLLSSVFASNPRVTVTDGRTAGELKKSSQAPKPGDLVIADGNSPYAGVSARQYVRYGKVGLGFTHSADIHVDNLPLVMADEFPDWSACRFREIHVGHLHNRKTKNLVKASDSRGSTTVRVLASLAGRDSWHANHGYNSLPGADAFLWHAEKGLLAHLYHTPADDENNPGMPVYEIPPLILPHR